MKLDFLTKFSLKNTIAVLLLAVLVIAGGYIASSSIKTETFPNVTFPVVSVQAVYPNASTEEVETKLTKPIEEQLLSLKGYESITSESRENGASFQVTYDYGKDLEEAKADIEEAISKAALPDGANDPEVKTLSFDSKPVYKAAISGGSIDDLQSYLENDVVPELEEQSNVQQVTLTGAREEKVKVTVDEKKANKYGLSLSDIQSAIEQENYKIPAGSIESKSGNIPMQVEGGLKDAKALKNVEITVPSSAGTQTGSQSNLSRQSNTPQQAQGGSKAQPQVSEKTILLSDVAKISTEKEYSDISRYNGQDSILLQVTKSQEGNTADVSDNAKEIVEKAAKDKGYTLHTVLNQGEDVHQSISSLLKEGGFGALFTVIVILLFLRNFRATIIAILSLPISIMGTIALLNQFGYTLNIMTLGGLAVAVGRIVDDSIVVIENIYRWKQKHPEMPQKQLVFKATKEVMGAISSSTIATLIVFLPLAFVSGILGEFFRPFSLAVVFSISISLITAIMLIPVLGSALFKKVKQHENKNRWSGYYGKFLRGALKRKAIVFCVSIALLIGSLAMIPKIGLSFIPSGDATALEVKVTLPEGTSINDTNETAKKIEKSLKGQKDIAYSQASIGFSEIRSFKDIGGSNGNTATFDIKLKEGTSINQALEKYEKQIKEIAQKEYKDALVNASEVQEEGPPSGNNVEINLYGDNLDHLRDASGQVEDFLKQDSRLKTIDNDMTDTETKWIFTLNEEGKDLHISPSQIVKPINERAQGITSGTVKLDDEEWKLDLSYDKSIAAKDEINNLTIMTGKGKKTLGELMDISETTVPSSIKHDDGETHALVSGVVKSGDPAKVTADIQKNVKGLKLPKDVRVDFSGGGQEMITDGLNSLGLAMLAAVVLVFLVLGITFGGFLTPMVILSSLIFIPVGSLTGLLLTGQSLSMPAMIGMLMLIGIVVTNAVVLLDRVETNRKEGMELTESIIEASSTRLRPILMTALATIFALIPLSLSDSSSGIISKGLAITVIGGLTSSTLLTLVFIPVLYQWAGKFKKFHTDDF